MTGPWVSAAGVVVPDLVPARLRREWVAAGLCPGRGLHALFAAGVAAHPDREAVVDDDGPVSYAALSALVTATAGVLAEAGLGRRDVVAVCLPDSRYAVAAELAVAALGAVSLPYPCGRGSRDALSLLGRSRAAGLVTAPGTGPPAGRLPFLRATVALGRAAPPRPARSTPAFAEVDAAEPARILVSSGSETEPKMVAYSHDAFAGGRAAYVRALHRGGGPMRNLVLVPLASSFGSCGVPVTVAVLGGTLLVRSRFDPAAALRLVREHRPTHLFGVPTMLHRIADLGPGATSLRAVVSSGAALPAPTARLCRERFGVPVVSVYGSTDGVNCHDATTGRPDPAVASIVVADEGGRPVPPGTRGEILARGPMTPLSYVAAPELDERYRTAGGWVRTGDEGLLDHDGVLHVTGRLRHVVIRGGLTISPAEVEAHLAGHPAVAEATCVGVPDADLGERLCACVVPRPGHPPPTLADLTGFLRGVRDLEPRKLPERLLVLAAFPLGPTGKVCRRTLAALATGG